MIVIHYPTAYKALDCFIDLFNEKAEKSSHKLRTGAVMTAKEIVRIYGISLLKANGCQEIDKEKLPPLQTNNMQLAKLVKCSSRTIQRHIIKLHAAGFITNKIFRGSNANYELLINPQILLAKEKLSVDKAKIHFQEVLNQALKNEVKSTISPEQKTNCPHTYSSNNSYKRNNIIITVDNSEKRSSLPLTDEDCSGYVTGNTTGNTGEIAQVFSEKQKNNIQEAGEIASRADQSGHRNVAPDTARDNSLTMYVSLFWLMARNLLYTNTDLTERQVMIAKKLIRKLYEPASTANLSAVHQQYVQRISLVAKFIQKDPLHRFVPLPYIYFDRYNPKGFVGTKEWYKADQQRKKEIERELTLSRLIRKYQNNEKRDVIKKKSALQLFRECENTLGKFNDPVLTQRFHSAVLQHETYRLVHANS